MKKLIVLALCMLFGISGTSAQSQKDIAKERKEISKLSEKELNARAGKIARKTARQLKAEGWTVAPGQVPLEKQLDRAYKLQFEYDKNAFPKYIIGEAQSIGENYDAARMQALELAKLNLAGQVQTEVTAITESNVANKQLSAEEAASVTESLTASKNILSMRLGRVLPMVECYRILPNKNKEVRILIAYGSDKAVEAAKQVVREGLEKKGDKLHQQLDNILKF